MPTTDFDGNGIWGVAPDEHQIANRLAEFHALYHEALSTELARVREMHGVAILYDCHSIRSHIPFLFEGTLPDFNIGTNNGETCAVAIGSLTEEICRSASGYTSVTDGALQRGVDNAALWPACERRARNSDGNRTIGLSG